MINLIRILLLFTFVYMNESERINNYNLENFMLSAFDDLNNTISLHILKSKSNQYYFKNFQANLNQTNFHIDPFYFFKGSFLRNFLKGILFKHFLKRDPFKNF